MNFDKSLAKGIGMLTDFIPDDNYGIKWTTRSISTLGVTISNDPNEITKLNCDTRLQTMSETLNVSTCRKLLINGKVTIPKSLALPKIHYAVSWLPITNETVKETDKLVLNFLWNRRRPKVKVNVIIPAIEDGGIKVPDFKSIFKANRVSWVEHLLTSKGKWKNILQSLIQTFLLDHFLQTNLSKEDIA